MDARLRGHSESIGQRMERDLDALLPLAPVAYDACERQAGRVSSLSLVRYKTNDYSVPVSVGHRDVLVMGYVDQVVIRLPLFDQPDRQEPDYGSSIRMRKPNRPKVPESKPIPLPQREEGPEEAHLPLFDFFGLEKCDFEPKFDLNQESAI